MIVTKTLAREIVHGRKTEARIPIRTSPDGVVRPCPYRPSPPNSPPRTYTVQTRTGGPEIARIEVLSNARARLADLTYPDVRAEGFRTTAAFADAWMTTHDAAWPPRQTCARCDGDGNVDCADCWTTTPTGPYRAHPLDAHPCPLCDGTGETLAPIDDDLVLARFTDRHHDQRVWIVRFRLLDAPRLLASDSSHGYTTRARDALPDEPEAVDDATLEHFARDAAERRAGEPGRRAEHARRLMRANQERTKRLLAADPAAVLALEEARAARLAAIEQHADDGRNAA
ncbi:hypothetical protein [Paraconexibacter algicola]|uniref:Uncharacterized protein n=1 Tax=Paraconexibacter algicola TaxID=2133960 RepID=A0A2T4UDZ7_9ACTN|nr:hypothetical protein [Paraconexibacter algicola]PTL55734.1 hypothetical protein C7Y72_19080 [Paraconexibacter algicola]